MTTMTETAMAIPDARVIRQTEIHPTEMELLSLMEGAGAETQEGEAEEMDRTMEGTSL